MTGPEPNDPEPHEPVGTLAEEAAKLFATLAGVAREQGADVGQGVTGLGDRVAAAAHDVDEHLATGGAECRYCPICRAVDLLRRTGPDVGEHLAEAAQSLSRAVAAMLATDNVEARRARATDVEHIDLDDEIGIDDELDPEADQEEDG